VKIFGVALSGFESFKNKLAQRTTPDTYHFEESSGQKHKRKLLWPWRATSH